LAGEEYAWASTTRGERLVIDSKAKQATKDEGLVIDMTGASEKKLLHPHCSPRTGCCQVLRSGGQQFGKGFCNGLLPKMVEIADHLVCASRVLDRFVTRTSLHSPWHTVKLSENGRERGQYS
jgi:hypothetical protein